MRKCLVLNQVYVPYCFLHCSKKGKRTVATLWARGAWPGGGVSTQLAETAFFMSLIFPSKRDCGGPLIPRSRRMDLSFFGFETSELYNLTTKPRKPITAIVVKILLTVATISMAVPSLSLSLPLLSLSLTVDPNKVYYRACVCSTW